MTLLEDIKLFTVDAITSTLEKHPVGVGYLAAGTSTAMGFWAIVDKLKSLGALLSIAFGLTLTIVTLRVQLGILRDQNKQKTNNDKASG